MFEYSFNESFPRDKFVSLLEAKRDVLSPRPGCGEYSVPLGQVPPHTIILVEMALHTIIAVGLSLAETKSRF